MAKRNSESEGPFAIARREEEKRKAGESEREQRKAQAKAKAENKLLLMDFTGSDWCPWCIKLEKEILSTPAFGDFAKKNLVLLYVDFPQHKQLSAEQKKANQELQKKYAIRGFPTVIVLNKDGKKVGNLGYQAGGPTPFIKELEKLKK